MMFSREMYSKVALLKSAYAFTDRAYVHLDANERYYLVELQPKPGCPQISEGEFTNEMLCQSIRHEVYRQTKTLRELLVARAMASTVIQGSGEPERPEANSGTDADAGAEAVDLAADDAMAADILADWFADGNA